MTTIDLDQYPLLTSGEVKLKPSSVFRVEGVPFYHDRSQMIVHLGNALFLFTGLIHVDGESGSEFIHCVPLVFYGPFTERLASLYSGHNVWVEVFNAPEANYFEEGYLN